MISGFETIEAGGARDHDIHRVFLRGNKIARRQGYGQIKIRVMRGGRSTTGPIINLFQFDTQRAADRFHRLIIFFSRRVQRTSGVIRNFQLQPP
jgi:hypothetical protein